MKLTKITKASPPSKPEVLDVRIMLASVFIDLHPFGTEINTHWVASAVVVESPCSMVVVEQSGPMCKTDIPISLYMNMNPIRTGS